MEISPATEIFWFGLLQLAAGSAVFGLCCAGLMVWGLRRTALKPALVKVVAAGEFVVMTGALLFLLTVAFPELWHLPVRR